MAGMRTKEAALLVQSDAGRAHLFARQYRGSIHWVPSHKHWVVWDDQMSRWLVDRTDMDGPGHGAATRLAKNFLATCCDEFDRSVGVDLEITLGKRRTIYDMLDLFKTEDFVSVPNSTFNTNPYLLGVSNGVVDLRTGQVREAQRADRITWHTDTKYDPDARDARWDRFLHEATGGDNKLRDFLQVYFGYSLTGSNSKEKFVLIRGRGGSGKGTLTKAIIRAISPYAMTTNHDSFLRHKAGTPREDLASWDGKRLVLTTELPGSSTLDANIIKALSGGDDFRARSLFRTGKELRQTWSCVSTCNRFPALDSTPDSGWWRRIICIPMPHVAQREDHTLKAHLCDPMGASRAVLAWLLEGSKSFYANGERFDPPNSVEKETMAFRAEADHMGFWLAETFDRDPNGWVSNADLWESYEQSCEDFLQEIRPKAWWGRRMEKEGFPSTLRSGGYKRGHHGLRFKPRRVSHIDFVAEEMRVNSTVFED